MYAILFASGHEVLAPYTHYFAAILAAIYIAFESPLSGISTTRVPWSKTKARR
jgi:hypothetical protein